MRNISLKSKVVLISAIALGCVSVSADAFARGGVGGAAAGHAASTAGAAAGHAASTAGVAGSHAGVTSRGAPASGVGHSRADGTNSFYNGHGFDVN